MQISLMFRGRIIVYLLSVNGNGWLEAVFISEQLFKVKFSSLLR